MKPGWFLHHTCLSHGVVWARLTFCTLRVKMRIFVGLQVQEIAAALNASEKTVQRDWTFAKAWLSRELKEGA